MKKVVIIGGGFGGLNAAKSLKNADVEIFLIDKTNHHLFQPLLYQVATAGLSPGYIAVPIRSILSKQKNLTVILGEVIEIDKHNKFVRLNNQEIIHYDFLIIAIGSRHTYFGNDDWEKIAPGLKTLEDAITIREKVLLAFEKAESTGSLAERKKYLTFVIIGGGPTGVELAGALAEIARKTMKDDFRRINLVKDTNIILIEAADRILTSYPEDLSEKAKKSLIELGVDVRLNTKVLKIEQDKIITSDGEIQTGTILWAAGNKVSSLLSQLEVPLDNIGRVIVEPDLTIPGDNSVYVIGDAACFLHQNNKPLPGVCPVAILEGRYVAKDIKLKLKNKKNKPFYYFDKGNLATIGRAKAVADFGFIRFSGFFAWLIWVFVHILFLIGFRNKFIVMTEWIWAYFTYQKSARLITKQNIN